jgi:hypothetical protein
MEPAVILCGEVSCFQCTSSAKPIPFWRACLVQFPDLPAFTLKKVTARWLWEFPPNFQNGKPSFCELARARSAERAMPKKCSTTSILQIGAFHCTEWISTIPQNGCLLIISGSLISPNWTPPILLHCQIPQASWVLPILTGTSLIFLVVFSWQVHAVRFPLCVPLAHSNVGCSNGPVSTTVFRQVAVVE